MKNNQTMINHYPNTLLFSFTKIVKSCLGFAQAIGLALFLFIFLSPPWARATDQLVNTATEVSSGFANGSLSPFWICTTDSRNNPFAANIAGQNCAGFSWHQQYYDGTRNTKGTELCSSLAIYKEAWYGFYLYVPSSGYPTDKETGIAQFFQNGSCSSWAAILTIKNNDLYIQRRAACVNQNFDLVAANIPRDVWIPIVIHWVASHVGAGQFQIWYNWAPQNSPTYNAQGINFGFGDWNADDTLAAGNSQGLKLGQYDYDNSNYTPGEVRTLFYANVSQIVGNPAGVFNYITTPLVGGPPPAPPAAPTGLAATAGNGLSFLNWATAANYPAGYNVKRSTSNGGPYTTLAFTTQTNYVDLGLTNGTTYYYVVSATNGAGASANSTQVSATPLAGPPGNTTVLIDVDINSGATTQTGAAVLGTAGDVWNGVTGNTSNLKNSTNTTLTGVGFFLSGNSGLNDNTGGVATMDAATTPLMRDCAYGANTTFTTGINGLDAYIGFTYTLVVYAAIGDPNQGSRLTLSGATGGNSATRQTTTGASRSLTNTPPNGGLGVAYQVFIGTITNSTLTITDNNNGQTPYGGVNGLQLQIVVPPDPSFLVQPVSHTTVVGQTTTFSATPVGTSPFSYQWQATNSAIGGFTNLVNGGQIAGANTNVLTIFNVSTNNALGYQLVVTNSVGSTTSSVASLTVNPGFLVNVDIGGTANVQTGAAVLGAAGDIWNGVTASTGTIKDSTGTILSGVGYAVAGYTGFNDQPGGSPHALMDAATTPLMRDCVFGQNATFTVSLTGLNAYLNNTITLVVYGSVGDPNQGDNLTLSGATGGNTSSMLTTTGASRSLTNSPPNGGLGVAYQVFNGKLTSGTLTITCANNGNTFGGVNGLQLLLVPTDPSILIQPTSRSVAAGQPTTFSVTPSGTSPFSYQWQATNNLNGFTNLVNGGQFAGVNTNVLTISNVTSNNALVYQVIVSNSSGVVTSSPAILKVLPPVLLVNVQYRGSANNPFGTYGLGQGTPYSGPAVLGSAGDIWNQEQIGYYYNGSPNPFLNAVPLVDSGNNASSLTLTLGFQSIIQGAALAGTATDAVTTNLMSGSIFIFTYSGAAGAGNAATTHTIGGLSGYAGVTANLVVYAAAPSPRTEQIAITGGVSGGNSGSTLTTSSSSRQISAGAGVAYQMFTNLTLTGSNLVFTVNETGAAANVNAGFVNGFQLQIGNQSPSVKTNAYLNSLSLSPAVTFAPVFASNVFSYAATTAYGVNPTVTVINGDLTATNQLIYSGTTNLLASGGSSAPLVLTLGGTNVVAVQVTAQDGVTKQTYAVNILQQPSQTKPVLTNSLSGGTVTLSWAGDHLGYRLLVQTNNLNLGVSSNPNDWATVPGSTVINATNILIAPTNSAGFYRLVYP
jgi:hypothetical protein